MALSTPPVSWLNGDPDAIINIHEKEIYDECFVVEPGKFCLNRGL